MAQKFFYDLPNHTEVHSLDFQKKGIITPPSNVFV